MKPRKNGESLTNEKVGVVIVTVIEVVGRIGLAISAKMGKNDLCLRT
jgi:hypothetical protein